MKCEDATLINSIVNAPECLPFMGGEPFEFAGRKYYHPLDFTEHLKEPEYFLFLVNETKDGLFIFERSAPRVWEIHTAFRLTCRGQDAVQSAIRMIDWMFEREGANFVWGMTPLSNIAARKFNEKIGADIYEEIDHAMLGRCEQFGLYRDQWRTKKADLFAK